jgi:hypothetical protein
VGFFVRWDGLDVPANPPYYPVGSGFQQALSVGGALGSRPAVIGSGVLGAAWLFFVALVITDDDYA